MQKGTLTVDVCFSDSTDLESLAGALDILMETALSSPGILEEYGDPSIGEFIPEASSMEQIRAELEKPDTDDATYLLRRVYELLKLPVPSFLEV